MAKTHIKPERTMPTTRYYTVSYVRDMKYNALPAITLKGHWLAKAGFVTGIPIEVKILPDSLILTIQKSSSPSEAGIVPILNALNT